MSDEIAVKVTCHIEIKEEIFGIGLVFYRRALEDSMDPAGFIAYRCKQLSKSMEQTIIEKLALVPEKGENP